MSAFLHFRKHPLLTPAPAPSSCHSDYNTSRWVQDCGLVQAAGASSPLPSTEDMGMCTLSALCDVSLPPWSCPRRGLLLTHPAHTHILKRFLMETVACRS